MYCRNCGKKLSDNAKFCDACGTSMGTAPVEAAQTKNPTTASVIAPRKTPAGGLMVNVAALLIAGYFSFSMFHIYAYSAGAFGIVMAQMFAILSAAAGSFFFYLRTPSKNVLALEAVFAIIAIVLGFINISAVSANHSYVGFDFVLSVVGGAVLALIATGINFVAVKIHGSKNEGRWAIWMFIVIILIGFFAALFLSLPLAMPPAP